MARRKYSDDDAVKMKQLAADLASGCIVTQALARYLEQVLEFVHEEYIAPLRKENAELRSRLNAE